VFIVNNWIHWNKKPNKKFKIVEFVGQRTRYEFLQRLWGLWSSGMLHRTEDNLTYSDVSDVAATRLACTKPSRWIRYFCRKNLNMPHCPVRVVTSQNYQNPQVLSIWEMNWIKFSVKPWKHTGEVEVYLHAFLTYNFDKHNWLASSLALPEKSRQLLIGNEAYVIYIYIYIYMYSL